MSIETKMTRMAIAVAATVLCTSAALGATWNGGGADELWSNAANWDVAPSEGSDVTFDGTSTKDCTLDVAPAALASIGSLTLASGYTGTITFNEDLNVYGAVVLDAGTIALNGHTITIRGVGDTLVYNGGVFTQGGAHGAIQLECATDTGTVNIDAAGSGQHGFNGFMTLRVVGAISATFEQTGDLTQLNSFALRPDIGATLTYNTNDFTLDGPYGTPMSTGVSNSNDNGTTILNCGASTITFTNGLYADGDADVFNWGSANITFTFLRIGSQTMTIDPGTSTVTLKNGNVGAYWLANNTYVIPFYNLVVDGTTVKLQQPISVANDLTITSGTLDTECSAHSPYKVAEPEPVTVKGNITIAAAGVLDMQHTSGNSELTLDSDGAQTLTDDSTGSTWGDIVISGTTTVTLDSTSGGASFDVGAVTVGAGCTLDVNECDVTGGALSNDGTIVQTGNEAVAIGGDGDSGTWRLIGSADGAAPPFTIPNLTVTGADFFDLEIYCAQTNAFTVAEGDLHIGGDLHVDNAATLSFSATDTMPVLTIDGIFTGNQTNITDAERLVLQGATGNRLSVVIDTTTGDVGTVAGTDIPNYVTFRRLMAPGVTFKPKRAMTWTGLVFSDLDDTHANGAYYLSVPNTTLKLTLDDVEFQDVVGGVDGDGSFDGATDPGTIEAPGAGLAPAVDVTSYTVSGLAYGGTASDGDTDGSYITWVPLIIPAFSLLTPVDATTGFAPVDGTLTWEQAQYVETYTVRITDGASFTHDEAGITTESWTPGQALLDYDTTYTWYVTAHNTDDDQQSTETTWTFTTKSDNDAPTVLSTTPVDGETNVPVTTTISVTFSEDMAAGTDLDFHLQTGGVDVTGTTTHVGDTVTFTPDVDLSNGTNYTITIDATAEDLNGNPLGGFTASFSTVAAPSSAESACVPGEGSPATMVFLVFAAVAVVAFGRRVSTCTGA